MNLSGKINTHYLQLPLMAEFSWKLSDDVRMNFGIGPYLALSLSHYTKYDVQTFGDPSYGSAYYYHQSGSGHVNDTKLEWGMAATTGFEVKNLLFNVGYDISLGEDAQKFHTLSLTVGYKFRLGK